MILEVMCNHCPNTAYLNRELGDKRTELYKQEQLFLFKELGWAIDNSREPVSINNLICQECL